MGWDFDEVILGEPASAKNQRRIVFVGGKPRIIKSKKALDYSMAFELQCPVLEPLIDDHVCVLIDVFYKSRRPDLAAIDLLADLLQGKVYINDRQVKASMSIWNLDKKNPRTRIRVKRFTADASTGLSSYKLSEIWGQDPGENE